MARRGATEARLERRHWTEESQWAWHFEDNHAQLVGELKDDKYFGQLRVRPGDALGEFILTATALQKPQTSDPPSTLRFVGKLIDDALVVTNDNANGDEVARITLRLVAGGDRLIALYEKRNGPAVFTRLAEVGSTRKGSSFAKAVASGPECVVTGGLGTIAVEYQGKKYYVCCTGCRDLFQEDPARALEEFRQRKAAEQAEKK